MSRKVTRLRFLAGSLGGVRAASATHSFPTVLVLLNHTPPIQYQNPSAFAVLATDDGTEAFTARDSCTLQTVARRQICSSMCRAMGSITPPRKSLHFNISTSLVLQVVCLLYKEIFPIPVVPKIPQLMLPDLLLDLCASPPQGIAALMALIDGHHNWKPLVTAVDISR